MSALVLAEQDRAKPKCDGHEQEHQAKRASEQRPGWVEQRLAGDRIGLLAGRYDLNTEFYFLPSATVLINSSFGTGPEFSESGRRGPSLFPDTAGSRPYDVKALPSLSGTRTQSTPFTRVHSSSVGPGGSTPHRHTIAGSPQAAPAGDVVLVARRG